MADEQAKSSGKGKKELTYEELMDQIAGLTAQAEAIRREQSREAINTIRELMAKYSLTANDILGRRGSAPSYTAPIKYRHPQTGETWTGRGKPPRWLTAEIDAGKKREDFLVA